MLWNPCFWSQTPQKQVFLKPKTEFFDPKTGNYFRTYFRTIFAKFSRVWKDRIFLKNFQTSITELFRNSRKQKVRKILSFAGPYVLPTCFLIHFPCFRIDKATDYMHSIINHNHSLHKSTCYKVFWRKYFRNISIRKESMKCIKNMNLE